MILINAAIDCKLDLASWYERVPSDSNIADLPSRLQFRELEEMGSISHEACHPASIASWKKQSTGL